MGATFFLSCNIVALQVETLCCAYYHVYDRLASQQVLQCYKSANFTRFIGQSSVNKDEARFHIIWRFGERPLGLLAVTFFFIFRANEGEKWYFCDSSSKPFAFCLLLLILKGKLGQYQTPRGLCIGQIYYFPRASRLLRIQVRLHHPP